MGAEQSMLTGYHVLQVAENSPGAKAGLEPFFDYITEAAGHSLAVEDDTLSRLLKDFENSQLPVKVFSSRYGTLRDVVLKPCRGWGGDGLLGLSIRLTTFSQDAPESVWHVTGVSSGGAGEQAGLMAGSDYIVGCPESLQEGGSSDINSIFQSHKGTPVTLLVYNHQQNAVRELSITPNHEGRTAITLGQGIMHRIPTTPFVDGSQVTVMDVITDKGEEVVVEKEEEGEVGEVGEKEKEKGKQEQSSPLSNTEPSQAPPPTPATHAVSPDTPQRAPTLSGGLVPQVAHHSASAHLHTYHAENQSCSVPPPSLPGVVTALPPTELHAFVPAGSNAPVVLHAEPVVVIEDPSAAKPKTGAPLTTPSTTPTPPAPLPVHRPVVPVPRKPRKQSAAAADIQAIVAQQLRQLR